MPAPARLLLLALLLAAAPAAAGDWDDLYEAEADLIAPYAERVSRQGDVLRLALADGGTVELANPPGYCEDPERCDVYSFFGHDAALAAYVVLLSHYESGEVLLVDDRDGRHTLVADLPHVSPDHARFIAVLSSEMQGYLLEMWRLTPDGPLREWAFESPVPLKFGHWLSPTAIELIGLTYAGDALLEHPLRLTQDATGWRLTGPTLDHPIP